MFVNKMDLRGFACFSKLTLDFSKSITVLVGKNNSGKSSLLKPLLALQYEAVTKECIRSGKSEFLATLHLGGIGGNDPYPATTETISISLHQNGKVSRWLHPAEKGKEQVKAIPSDEPQCFAYPFLSGRKNVGYSEDTNSAVANRIGLDFTNLYARIDNAENRNSPGHTEYIKECEKLIGYPITCVAGDKGRIAAWQSGEHRIPLTEMGAGIPSIIYLLTVLCSVKNKLIVMEEPENDLHPAALKEIMSLIVRSAQNRGNQFVITTHSNIVLRYLGAEEGTRIYSVQPKSHRATSHPPESTVEDITNDPGKRAETLRSLGYEFSDLDLWDAWLFLEESSSERLIRDHFIRWYVPELTGRLRTFSARTIDEVEPKFEDFNRLFVFLHLTSPYKNRVWVILDGNREEEEGRKGREEQIIDRMKETYSRSGWKEDRFLQFGEHDFERYYPEPFHDRVEQVVAMEHGKEKQDEKEKLRQEVFDWILEDDARAREAFRESAKDVIGRLKAISTTLQGEERDNV